MKSHSSIKIDAELLSRLKQGDEGAFDSVYRRYGSWVYNFIHSLLFDKQLTEDLTQTVFLKIWEKRQTIDPELGLDAYLFAISRNLVYKETENRMQFIYQSDTSDNLIGDSRMEENIDADSLRSYINDLIDELPPARKQIFKLSRYNHLSNKEIASRLNISEKTVENQITRALHYLKQKLAEDSHFVLLLFLLVKGC
ncbi:RNA polymerase sigma factor [Parabacteroides sp.]